MLISSRRRNAIVSDQRLGEDQDLTTIGRICQGFWISDKRSGEDSFAGDIGLGSERLAIENWAILDT